MSWFKKHFGRKNSDESPTKEELPKSDQIEFYHLNIPSIEVCGKKYVPAVSEDYIGLFDRKKKTMMFRVLGPDSTFSYFTGRYNPSKKSFEDVEILKSNHYDENGIDTPESYGDFEIVKKGAVVVNPFDDGYKITKDKVDILVDNKSGTAMASIPSCLIEKNGEPEITDSMIAIGKYDPGREELIPDKLLVEEISDSKIKEDGTIKTTMLNEPHLGENSIKKELKKHGRYKPNIEEIIQSYI